MHNYSFKDGLDSVYFFNLVEIIKNAEQLESDHSQSSESVDTKVEYVASCSGNLTHLVCHLVNTGESNGDN